MRLDPAREHWMGAKGTRAVMEALTVHGGDARFVGGAVRNALMQRPVDDVDIATPLLPDEVLRRLSDAQIKAVPTGIAHGTVTAIVDGKAFEITTLRRDVATDGRHATVAFSQEWAEDAARRDFTINALYASIEGEVFDYTGGIADLGTFRIRFIGEPSERIREDYLRILRLFRFHAWYGAGEIDDAALLAATGARASLKELSGERIQKEILRLLEAQNPVPSLRAMAAAKILAEIHPALADLERVERLVTIDADNFLAPDPVLRLGALLPADSAVVDAFATCLKLSNQDRDRLLQFANTCFPLSPYLPVQEVRKLLYRWGTRPFRDRLFLGWLEDTQLSNDAAWRALLALVDAWIAPKFPLSGREIMAAGIPEGAQVGRALADLREWWIERHFPDDPSALAEKLSDVVRTYSK